MNHQNNSANPDTSLSVSFHQQWGPASNIKHNNINLTNEKHEVLSALLSTAQLRPMNGGLANCEQCCRFYCIKRKFGNFAPHFRIIRG